jgi:predicted DNA-binding transcriptional regulator YafY
MYNREEVALRINTKQIRRLVTIMDMLRQDSCPTTEGISLKVMAVDPMQRASMRTINRDIGTLREEFGAPIFFDRDRMGFRLPDGGAMVELLFVSPDAVTDWVLRQRGLAVVIHPETLAESIAEIASQIAGMHARDHRQPASGGVKKAGRQKTAKSGKVRSGRSVKAEDVR